MKKINYNHLCCYNAVETQLEYFDPEVLVYSLAIIYTQGQFQYLEDSSRDSTLFLIENEVTRIHHIFDNTLGSKQIDTIEPSDLYEAIVRAVVHYYGTAGALHREDLQQVIEAFTTAFYIADGDGLIDLPAPPLIFASHLPFGEDRLTDLGDYDFLHRIEQHIPGEQRVFGAMATHRGFHVYTQSAESIFEYAASYKELGTPGTLSVEESPKCECQSNESPWCEDFIRQIEDTLDN